MGFCSGLSQNDAMQGYLQILSLRLLFFLRLFGWGVCLLAGSLPLLANTPGLLRSFTPTGCYCNCAVPKGCTKMCDSRKHAARWWANTCVKPHLQTPDRNSGAHPRLPHPGRAEHAQLQK